jgi:hypothetical protein
MHQAINFVFISLITCPSGQKPTLSLLATVTLEIVTFRVYVPFPELLPFFYASWKSCSVSVFSTAYDSASITSVVSKWRPFSFIFNRANGEK